MSDQNNLFCVDQFAEVSEMIEAGLPTSIIGIPGCGISVFLKQLATQPFGKVLHIDAFSLPALTAQEFFGEILNQLGGSVSGKDTVEIVHDCIAGFRDLMDRTQEKVVIIVSGFDKLANDFNPDFFRYIRSLNSIDQSRIVFVFGICRRLETILPKDLTNLDIRLLANSYYLKRYNSRDLRYLLDKYGPKPQMNDEELEKLIKLSGGHFQFLQLLLQSEYKQTPLDDPFIKLSFENIWSHLSATQKNQVSKVAADKQTQIDNYLLKVGIIIPYKGKYQIFSLLFADCVRKFSLPKLPVKERRLLSALKKREGKVVSKRDLFDAIWRSNEIGSEWALNALIYRLRKHPAFTSQNYRIESNKKLGYTLIKNV